MRSWPIAIALFVVASLASAESPRSARPEKGGIGWDSFTGFFVNNKQKKIKPETIGVFRALIAAQSDGKEAGQAKMTLKKPGAKFEGPAKK